MNPYNPGACCGSDCSYFGADSKEPCWGNVHLVDEVEVEGEYRWIHECEGHSGVFSGYAKYNAPAPAAHEDGSAA